MENGVNFDLDNNEFAEKTGLIVITDRFLVFDRNVNGVIDNGSELFGDQVVLKSGKQSESGYESLSELNDSGTDCIIDENDICFDKLMVWRDANHNVLSENDELEFWRDAGVVSISFVSIEIRDGEKIEERAVVTLVQNGCIK